MKCFAGSGKILCFPCCLLSVTLSISKAPHKNQPKRGPSPRFASSPDPLLVSNYTKLTMEKFLFRRKRLNQRMFNHFSHLVVVVHKHHNRFNRWQFFGVHPRFGQNNNLIPRLKMPRRRTIETDIAVTTLSLHGIGAPQNAVGNIGDLHDLKRLDVRRVKNVAIYRD